MNERFNAVVDVLHIEFEETNACVYLKVSTADETAMDALYFYDDEDPMLCLSKETVRGVIPGDRVVVSGTIEANEEEIFDVQVQIFEVAPLQDFDIETEDDEETN